jgi:uncharacterized membrane protein YfhO
LKGDTGAANNIFKALTSDRENMERTDAMWSLGFVLVAFGIMWAYLKDKMSVTVLSVAILALVLIDLWRVDRRYLNENSFAEKQESYRPQPREVDTFIQRDTDPDFRVIDLTQTPKFDLTTPFFHKSIWGYSAARLKRFDEIIDNQFGKSLNQDVLDMLNTKYVISQDPKTGSLNMQHNQTACGHAWFVQNIEFVKNADEEMKAITAFSPKEKAIVDERFKKVVESGNPGVSATGTIDLVRYSPDDMVYKYGSTANSVAVFSEIYYDKGWTMYVDGKEQPYFRADYILRAAVLPVGNHTVEFKFHPASYYTGEKISLAGSILLVLALGGVIFMGVRNNKTEEKAKKA